MSSNYADGLSEYADKGILGVPEKFDTPGSIQEKSSLLAKWISEAEHVVVHTGAGISTAAGIPDFRGPKGVWTLERKGLKPTINISFNEAIPTKTHMALTKLVEIGKVHYVISQNIDGLHLRSGLPRERISELHGNIFTETCRKCNSQFIRRAATTSVGQKSLGSFCPGSTNALRGCRGKLHDTILDWEDHLPPDDLVMAEYNSNLADLSICLGTTLQIVPSGNLPIATRKYGGRLAIVNLQPTKQDKKANLLINGYVDEVIEKIMKCFGLEIPEYNKQFDPTKQETDVRMEWNFLPTQVQDTKVSYELHTKKFKRIKLDKKFNEGKKKVLPIKFIRSDIKEESTTKQDEVQKKVDIKEHSTNICDEDDGSKNDCKTVDLKHSTNIGDEFEESQSDSLVGIPLKGGTDKII